MSTPISSRKPLSALWRYVLALLVVGTCVAVKSARAEEQQAHYLSDDIIEELGKLDEFQKNKQWDQMIQLLEKLYNKAKPESYDASMMLQYLGNVYLIKNDLTEALKPLEAGLRLSEKYNYYKPDVEQQVRYYIAQIYYQNAVAKGASHETQVENAKAALTYLEKWYKINTKPNPDATVFYASILFNLAQINSGVQGKVDPNYLNQAIQVIKLGLTETVRPKENLYLLMITCLQLQDKYAEAADYFEILLRKDPSKKDYWQQLFATYYQLGQDSDPKKAFEYSVRAIVTIDRAQAHGFMNLPKDNSNRVSIYFNLQQYNEAAKLLSEGLHNGGIEDTVKNWEILAYAYQQVNKEMKAIETLKEAIKRYPDDGQLYFTIAQNYYAMDNSKDAYDYARRALAVGNVEKPYAAQSFVAYMAFDLRKYDDGLEAANKALEYPESKKDTHLVSLRNAFLDEIKRREQNKKAIEAQRKSL